MEICSTVFLYCVNPLKCRTWFFHTRNCLLNEIAFGTSSLTNGCIWLLRRPYPLELDSGLLLFVTISYCDCNFPLLLHVVTCLRTNVSSMADINDWQNVWHVILNSSSLIFRFGYEALILLVCINNGRFSCGFVFGRTFESRISRHIKVLCVVFIGKVEDKCFVGDFDWNNHKQILVNSINTFLTYLSLHIFNQIYYIHI